MGPPWRPIPWREGTKFPDSQIVLVYPGRGHEGRALSFTHTCLNGVQVGVEDFFSGIRDMDPPWMTDPVVGGNRVPVIGSHRRTRTSNHPINSRALYY